MPIPSIIARINPPITAEPTIAAGPSEKIKIRSIKRVKVTYVELVIQHQSMRHSLLNSMDLLFFSNKQNYNQPMKTNIPMHQKMLKYNRILKQIISYTINLPPTRGARCLTAFKLPNKRRY
jgi:hypothetical protein